ncbi:MAG: anthranilate phosphoribosyltransferase [Planctomycetota bacterium]
MPNSFPELLAEVQAGRDLGREQVTEAIGEIMTGLRSDEEIGGFLTALAEKGETVDEIAGAAAAMRRHMTPIRSSRPKLLDTCGTGGDSSGTFNISTAAAIVVAAAGVPVAKHGNRSVTSKSGSADVLAALGVNIEADLPLVERCLDELGLCFCFAPLMHPAMKNVAAVRKRLGIRTVFNLLGPLSNPAGAHCQLLGVGKPELRPMLAAALAALGAERALVVCGDDSLDEVSLATTTSGTSVSPGGLEDFRWKPEDFGINSAPLDTLRVSGPEESAAVIRGILAGEPGPPRDIVLLNAAAGLIAAQETDDPQEAAARCAEVLDTGAAKDLLARLKEMTAASA